MEAILIILKIAISQGPIELQSSKPGTNKAVIKINKVDYKKNSISK